MTLFAIFMCAHLTGCARYDDQVFSVRRVCEAKILAEFKSTPGWQFASQKLDARGRLLVSKATRTDEAVYAECVPLTVDAPTGR